MRLLVVEDDHDLNRQIVTALEKAGYAVDRAFDGEEGQFLGETEPYDAVILDLGLPKVDGVSVLTAGAGRARPCPILILTARDRWSDKVERLRCRGRRLCRPSPSISRNCWRACARCCAAPPGTRRASSSAARSGSTPARAACVVDGNAVKLTSHEYRLLSYLMHHEGRIVSRAELIEHLYDQDFDRDSNTIEVFVGRSGARAGLRYHPDRARPRLYGDAARGETQMTGRVTTSR